MQRRDLLKLLAVLPFGGVLTGVIQQSATARELRKALSTEVLEGLAANRRVYAEKGEYVVCENGHVICRFARTVYFGEIQDPKKQLTGWRQREPSVGEYPIPRCAKCGALFTDGSNWHFAYGWQRN